MVIQKLWRQGLLIKTFVGKVFPLVDKELGKWSKELESCSCEVLKQQAQESIKAKRFHAQGGSIYALYPGVNIEAFVSFVVAFQTISDYLDNLCDRAGVYEERAFRHLHQAMMVALDPGQYFQQDYYKYYPYKGDGQYLSALVQNCQQFTRNCLPGYEQVKEEMLLLAGLYAELQSLKHLALDIREQKLLTWANSHKPPELSPWEFAAATGSTLGMFMLTAASSQPDLTSRHAKQIIEAYFPWITGLHILLDYFIDQEEDRLEGDLNFVYYYTDAQECKERLNLFLVKALEQAQALPQPFFHLSVVEGLLAMYLSDPKAFQGANREISRGLLDKGGFNARLLHRICQVLRCKGKL